MKQVFRVSGLVPGPIVAHIGRICVHWSILELRIEQAIWNLSNLDRDQGRVLTAKKNLDPRLKLLKKCGKEKLSAEKFDQLSTIVTEIKKVGKMRNWAVHGLYGADASGKFHSITYRDSPKGKSLEMNDHSMRAIRNSISEVRRQLEQIFDLQ